MKTGMTIARCLSLVIIVKRLQKMHVSRQTDDHELRVGTADLCICAKALEVDAHQVGTDICCSDCKGESSARLDGDAGGVRR